jgi:glycosyltransferase involved in cell wall biosynthesis
MLSERVPRVGLGMPVYNAERYIEDALDSLMAQTFEDFEIVISDNASTDRTEEICRTYAGKDDRIRYVRYRDNYGMVDNFNSVFRLSRGEYFKWCASDDVCAPDYLRRAVEVLDADPAIVLAFPLVVRIDGEGRRRTKSLPGQISDQDTFDSVSSLDPAIRFRKLMRHIWWVDAAFYGLMRADTLSQTSLHPYHVSGDQLLIAEMALRGRFYEIPEELFFSRYHDRSTSRRQKSRRERVELIENKRLGRATAWWKVILDHPSRIAAYASFVRNAPMSRKQRFICYYEIAHSLAWWTRLRLHGFLARWRDLQWLRPDYPPRQE